MILGNCDRNEEVWFEQFIASGRHLNSETCAKYLKSLL